MGQTNQQYSNRKHSGTSEEMFEYSSSTETKKEGRYIHINFVIFQESNDSYTVTFTNSYIISKSLDLCTALI